MSRAARVALGACVVALAAVAVAIVLVTRDGGGDAPVPGIDGPPRHVAVDPGVALPHVVEVSRSDVGCPGHAFRAPAEPMLPPSADGAVTIRLPDDAAMLTVCLGAVAELGTPEELVAELWRGSPDLPGSDLLGDAAPDPLTVARLSSAHGDAVVLTSRVGRWLVTDHYVARDGMVHVVGYLRQEALGDAHLPQVESLLATWEWR